MDRLIYTAMSGSAQALEQQAIVANNLANASTTGFRAQLETYRAVPMSFGDGSSINDNTTRTFVLSSTPGADYTPGPIQQTGNPLDVAIQGPGWLSVQTADGNEAYTRAGNLHVDENGQLVNATNQVVLGNGGPVSVPPGAAITIGKDGTVSALTPGDPPTAVVTVDQLKLVNATNQVVLGNGGPVSVPPGAEITIGKDGTVSALTPGDPPTAVVTVDQLKLVNPDPQTMTRGDDGLFRTADGNPADADPAVTLAPASLEGSNVNPVSAMVSMITNARQFQMQTKLLENADKNDQSANQLLSFS